jgi:hypothetical protein
MHCDELIRIIAKHYTCQYFRIVHILFAMKSKDVNPLKEINDNNFLAVCHSRDVLMLLFETITQTCVTITQTHV